MRDSPRRGSLDRLEAFTLDESSRFRVLELPRVFDRSWWALRCLGRGDFSFWLESNR